MKTMLQTISIKVYGEVQGVYYRQRTKEMALQLGIGGSAMNLPDGTVEIVATGTIEQLEKLISWCWQGTKRAKVANLVTKELPLQAFDQFIIKSF